MRIILILLFLLVNIVCNGQTSTAKVVLKSGVTITGIIKEMVINDHIKITVSGVDTTILMSDIESITNIEGNEKMGGNRTSSFAEVSKKAYGAYEITDQNSYPETFVLELDGQKLNMVLVRGGVFNMGYDDRHSLDMKSEPIHQVTLSSFYVSKESVSRRVAQKLLNLKLKEDKRIDDFYSTYDWDEADKLVKSIADLANKPYRMLTEAEWEYVSLMPFAKDIFGDQKYVEWCNDFFDKYMPNDQINPTGPDKGKYHVTRSYNARRNKWDRVIDQDQKLLIRLKPFIRLAISADKIK